jgi:hypothetical protein
MRPRLAAAAAGTVLIAAAVIGFGLSRHPVVASTNTVEPFAPGLKVPGHGDGCQVLPGVPTGATKLQLSAAWAPNPAPVVSVALTDSKGLIATGKARSKRGPFQIELNQATRGSPRATLCLHNQGRDTVVMAGEVKRVRPLPGRGVTKPLPLASVIFLKPGTLSWAGRMDTILERFGFAQAGASGEWALWLAGALALVAMALGLAWVLRREGT